MVGPSVLRHTVGVLGKEVVVPRVQGDSVVRVQGGPVGVRGVHVVMGGEAGCWLPGRGAAGCLQAIVVIPRVQGDPVGVWGAMWSGPVC